MLGEGAFKDCIGLKSVIFPARLERIGEKVFSGCENVGEISFLGKLSWWKTAMERSLSWHEGCAATVVKCADGIAAI